MVNTRSGRSTRRLKQAREASLDQESSSDRSIEATGGVHEEIPTTPPETNLTKWKRPRPKNSDSGEIATASSSHEVTSIRELWQGKRKTIASKPRRSRRLREVHGLVRGREVSVSGTSGADRLPGANVGDNGEDKDGSENELVDPAALDALIGFSLKPRKLLLQAASDIEVLPPANAQRPPQRGASQETINSTSREYTTRLPPPPTKRPETRSDGSSVSRSETDAYEVNHLRSELSPDLSFEVTISPRARLEASTVKSKRELARREKSKPARLQDSGNNISNNAPDDYYSVSHLTLVPDEHSGDQLHVFHPPVRTDKKTTEVQAGSTPRRKRLKRVKKNKEDNSAYLMGITNLAEVGNAVEAQTSSPILNKHRSKQLGSVTSTRHDGAKQDAPTRSPTASRPLRDHQRLAQRSATSKSTGYSRPITRLQDSVLTVDIPSLSLYSTRLSMGLNNSEKPWVTVLLNALEGNSYPTVLTSKLGRKIFMYIRILKKDSEKAPQAPDFSDQAKRMGSKRSDHEQYAVSIDGIISKLVNSHENDGSDTVSAKELAYCIVPAVFLALWATFMLGGCYEGETGVPWPAKTGSFTSVVLRQLRRMTNWILELEPLLRRVLKNSSANAPWGSRTSSQASFGHHMREFSRSLGHSITALDAADDALRRTREQMLQREAAERELRAAERERLSELARREQAQRTAIEVAKRQDEAERKRKYDAMCRSTYEMRKKSKLEQDMIQRAMATDAVNTPQGLVSTQPRTILPVKPFGGQVSSRYASDQHPGGPGLSRSSKNATEKPSCTRTSGSHLATRTVTLSPAPNVAPKHSLNLERTEALNTRTSSVGRSHQLASPILPNASTSAKETETIPPWPTDDSHWLLSELMECGGKVESWEVEGWAGILDRGILDIEAQIKVLKDAALKIAEEEGRPVSAWAAA